MKFPSFYSASALSSILFFSCLYLSSCKKTEPTTPVPTPNLSSQMLGQYEVQLVTVTNSPAGVTINPSSVTISVEGNNNALDAIILTTAYSYTSISDMGKKVEQHEQSKSVRLQQSGIDVAVYDANTKVGYWHENTLTLTNYLLGSSTFNVFAVKR